MPHNTGDFDDFYRSYYPRLVRFAGKLFPGLDEEEIAQETLARVCERFDSLHPDRDPWPFITQIARRIAFDAYRRRSRVVAVDSTAITALVEDVAPPADLPVTDSETRLELARAMDSLSGEHRRILRWRVIEGRSSAEIAEELGITPNAARQKVFRACKALTTAYFRVVPGASVVFGLVAAIRRLSRKLRPAGGGAGGTAGVWLAAVATVAVTAGVTGIFAGRPPERRATAEAMVQAPEIRAHETASRAPQRIQPKPAVPSRNPAPLLSVKGPEGSGLGAKFHTKSGCLKGSHADIESPKVGNQPLLPEYVDLDNNGEIPKKICQVFLHAGLQFLDGPPPSGRAAPQ